MRNDTHITSKADLSLPVFGAITIHLVLGVILLGTWQFSHKKPEEFKIPDSIQAKVVVLEKPEPKPVVKPVKQTPPKPKPKPKPQPKAEPKPVVKETPKPVVKTPEPEPKAVDITKAEPAVKAPEPEPVVPEPEPVVEKQPEQSDEDLLSDLFAGLAEEETEISEQIEAIEQSQARQAEINAQVNDYVVAITVQVEEKWSRPVELRLMDLSRIEAVVAVELLPTGELQSATIVKPSGIDNYDQSVLRAIEKVRRFNVPDDSEVFEAGGFRRLNITFRPEDLMKP